MAVDGINWEGVDPERLDRLYAEYVARGRRADWMFEQLETKAHRILMISVPLASAGVALVTSSFPSPALQCGTWTAVILLSASTVMALLSLWPRRYSRPVGFIAEDVETAKGLNRWLHGGNRETALQTSNIPHMDDAIADNEGKNAIKGRLVWWALLLLGLAPALAGLAAWLAPFVGNVPAQP